MLVRLSCVCPIDVHLEMQHFCVVWQIFSVRAMQCFLGAAWRCEACGNKSSQSGWTQVLIPRNDGQLFSAFLWGLGCSLSAQVSSDISDIHIHICLRSMNIRYIHLADLLCKQLLIFPKKRTVIWRKLFVPQQLSWG